MTEIVTAADLAELLTGQLRKVWSLDPDRPAGWQELACAQDVAEALRGALFSAKPVAPPSVAALVQIPIIVTPDAPPGTWRLSTHGNCEVVGTLVTHERCTFTEGVLRTAT